jgi:hypothetical protein
LHLWEWGTRRVAPSGRLVPAWHARCIVSTEKEAIMTRQLSALALAAALLPHAAAAQTVENHLSCWTIKDSAPAQRYQTTVITPPAPRRARSARRRASPARRPP